MTKSAAFESSIDRYDDWHVRHHAVYLSELLAIRALLPWKGRGLEVGRAAIGHVNLLGGNPR